MPSLLTPSERLGALKVRGKGLSANLVKAVVGAPAVDLSSSQVSQMTLTIDDPRLEILESGIFDERARIDYLDLALEVAAIEVLGGAGDPYLAITARSRGAQKMKRDKGELVTKNVSPTEFMEARSRHHGLDFVGEPSAKRAQVIRAEPRGSAAETDWTAGQRLASELGYWFFEAYGVVYFGRPRWLIKRTRELTVRYPRARADGEIAPSLVPTCRLSVDAEEGRGRTIDLWLPYDGGGKRAIPGALVEFAGVHGFAGDYIVVSANFTLAQDSEVNVSLAKAVDPKPEPPEAKSEDLNEDGIADITGGAVSDGSSGSRSDQASAAGYTWPVDGEVTSGFGPRGAGFHYGVDISAADGTRCRAAKGGSVKFVGYDADGYGHWVEIDHGGGYTTRYGHFQSPPPVSVGQRVERGAVIGYTDSTGNARGPHLHFEVRHGGDAIDPLEVLP